MTDDRLDYWISYLTQLRDALKLSEWRVCLEDKPPENDKAGAVIRTLYGRREAWIRLTYGFDRLSPEKQRLYATHELIHLYFVPIQSVMDRAAGVFGDQATLTQEYHLEQVEYSVDGLSEAIAPFLPLPPASGKENPDEPT